MVSSTSRSATALLEILSPTIRPFFADLLRAVRSLIDVGKSDRYSNSTLVIAGFHVLGFYLYS